MSNIERAKDASSTLIRRLEGVLKNLRKLHCDLGRESSSNPSSYNRALTLTPYQISQFSSKKEKDVNVDLEYLRFKKDHRNGEFHYNVDDILIYWDSVAAHCFGDPRVFLQKTFNQMEGEEAL